MGACKSKDTVLITDPRQQSRAAEQTQSQRKTQQTKPRSTPATENGVKSPYRLLYFGARARAEHIRLIFAAGGLQFEDVRVSQEEWPALKPKTPMGFMPVLEIDGKDAITQNVTVARFVAKQCKLVPESFEDQALADSIVDGVIDLREDGLIPIVFEKDPKVKASKFEKLLNETVPTRLKQLEALLGSQNFFVNDKVSWADIELFCIVEQMKNAHKQLEDVINQSAKIVAHFDRVSKLPRIAKYLKGDRAAIVAVINLDDATATGGESKRSYKLQYFPVRARAEHIRMLFAAGDVAFEDAHVSQEDWPALKPKTPMGFLPTLEIDGKEVITQNSTVARYVAKECKLVPEDAFDAALADSVVDAALDLREEGLIPVVFGKDDEKASKMEKMVKETLPTRLKQLENILGDQDFFVNNKLSWADIEVFCVMEQLKNAHTQFSGVVSTSKKLSAHFQRVAKLPNMVKYLEGKRAATMLVANIPDVKRTYKLQYFPVRARAEHIRMLFAAGGVAFEDVHVSQEDWPALKPKTPMGFLPTLEIDGKEVITQNATVARFVAKECKLVPEDAFGAALADSVADAALDLREEGLIPIVFAKDEEKVSKMEKMVKETLPTRLKQLENILGNQDFFVNNKLSWADIQVFCAMEQLQNAHDQFAGVISTSKQISAHFQRVAKLPNMAKYLEGTRAVTMLVANVPDVKAKRSYKFKYFPARGRGEHIRMIFAAGGLDFEDVKITQEEWPALKPKTPMGFLPVLEIDGKEEITQNATVARYVAKECNLAGDNAIDQALADSVADAALDLREDGLIPSVFGDAEQKTSKFEKLKTETLPTRLKQFEAILGDQDFFVSNKLSYADIEVFCVMEQMKNAHEELATTVNSSATISQHFDRISKLPKMAAYLNDRDCKPILIVNL